MSALEAPVVARPGRRSLLAEAPAPRRRSGGSRGGSRRLRRHEERWVLLAWGALMFNVLTFSADRLLVPIPTPVGQAMTQGSLAIAVLAALAANPRGVVRLRWYPLAMTVLAAVALMLCVHNQFPMGSTFRAIRLTGFVTVLWLLTPLWTRRDMLLLRCHRLVLGAVLGSVVLGALVSPGLAFSFDGRLSGILWPIPPTQVGHYAAILIGTTVVLWMTRVLSTRWSILVLAATGVILLATHTRTALLATVVGLVVATASLFLGHARVRRTTIGVLVVGVVAGTALASPILHWLTRGESAENTANLTGRTKVWTQVFQTQRPLLNDLFGSGLSNRSFNGLPIDSNWVATYVDQGWFGILLEAGILIALLGYAATRARGAHRGVALFLVVYCVIASITETGLGDASPYVLDLTVAAAMLSAAGPRRAVSRGPA